MATTEKTDRRQSTASQPADYQHLNHEPNSSESKVDTDRAGCLTIRPPWRESDSVANSLTFP